MRTSIETPIILTILLFNLTNGFYIPLDGNEVNRSNVNKMDHITISKLKNASGDTDDDFSPGGHFLETNDVSVASQKIFVDELTREAGTKEQKKLARFQRDQKSKAKEEDGVGSNLQVYIKGSAGTLEKRNSDGEGNAFAPIQCAVIPDTARNPYLCYQCSSTFDDKDPICDHTLWRFTRRSEKYKLRVRCPHGRGNYCVKKVQRKRGEQLTERGCFGPGPVQGKDGSLVELQEGCVTYRQNGFLTTTCLCKGDLCNFGSRIFPHGGILEIVTIVTVSKYFLL